MTQHVDEVARAIRDEDCAWVAKHGGYKLSLEHGALLSRAAMRAVVKQMREPSEAMLKAAYDAYGLRTGGDTAKSAWTNAIRAMLDAYAKEARIDD